MSKFILPMPSEHDLPENMRGMKYHCEKCKKEIKEHQDKPKDCHHVDAHCLCCSHTDCHKNPKSRGAVDGQK